MRRVIIVQARMTSSRLPGKVLMDLAGSPMLAQQLRRLKNCRLADEIIVATTTNDSDNLVVALAEAEQVGWFRGSENDVLSRYLGAAREAKADIVVRVTADCPLIDPEVTDRVIAELEDNVAECDYASNVVVRTFPAGLDTEALCRDALERIGRLGLSSLAREHVTHFVLKERPELFLVRSVTDPEDHSGFRWTVDTADDMARVRRIFEELELTSNHLSYLEIISHSKTSESILTL